MTTQKKISAMARKAVQMTPSSLRMLIFATDVLLARDQMEKESQAAESSGALSEKRDLQEA